MGWGLILRALGDSMAFSSHLIIEEAVIDLVLDRFDEALDETAEWLASPTFSPVFDFGAVDQFRMDLGRGDMALGSGSEQRLGQDHQIRG